MLLPGGTITFLFTDIEGSTKLWELFPAEMPVALARHDALMRAAIAQQDGYIFKTMGDSFCGAFATASQAALAALAAQQAVHEESWNLPAPVWVRMALHTGTAEVRDNDYFGQPLNRLARLLSIGHGGQILLSLAAQELARDALPPEVTLRELGTHRLKDLARPETVYQLCHPALTTDFPPLRSLDNPALPNNLPEQVTSFIGREKETREVRSLLQKVRLLTLVGSGGCGKTRLSLQVAADLLEEYPDGVWFVELAALTDPLLIPQAVARVIGVREEVGKTLTQTVTDHLKTRRVLLILDNCEHLLNACASLATTLLQNCPPVTMLASSREGMGIAGEQTYRIPSLSLPEAGMTATPTPESLTQYEAVRLFIDRAVSVQSTFAVTNANAPAVAQLCVHLDGIPLAIELAAARVRSLSVEEINSRLDNRFRLLTGGSRTALPRQQTLRALIDWSYDLLIPVEKRFLSCLSVFIGGWTLAAAEQVCSNADNTDEPEIEDWEVLDLLSSLADKSLVVAEPQPEGNTRYRLLETVREYARDRLAETEGQEAIRGRHQAFFLALTEEASPQLRGPDQGMWLHRLEQEHDNIRRALDWDNGASDEDADRMKLTHLRLAGAMTRFWYVRGYVTEGRKRLEGALAGVETISPSERTAVATVTARAKALRSTGVLAHSQGDYQAARPLYEQSLTLFRELDNKHGIADALGTLAWASYSQGDYASARPLAEESLGLFRELGRQQQVASSLNNVGLIARCQGDYPAARRCHEESLIIARELGDKHGISLALLNLGWVAKEEGDWETARIVQEESLEIARELGDKRGIALLLIHLGGIAYFQRDFETARSLIEESLALSQEFGDKQGIADALSNLGIIAHSAGDSDRAKTLQTEGLSLYRELGDKGGTAYSLEAFAAMAMAAEVQSGRAARLWGAAEQLREVIGAPLPPSERADYEQKVSEARATLGVEPFAESWAEGRTLTMEQAIEFATGG
ncbi:MAG: tetratricopeptide repeat protein [Fibrella sp.]|nr:tetratricopeptide repeat protein [Armatimonadota bacterium]